MCAHAMVMPSRGVHGERLNWNDRRGEPRLEMRIEGPPLRQPIKLPAQTVIPYQKTNRFRVRYLIDPKFSLPRTFGFNYTPSLALVDAGGVLLHKKGGYSPNERISDLLRTFVK